MEHHAQLSDGRLLTCHRIEDGSLTGYWEVWIGAETERGIMGSPLEETIAAFFGFDPAQDEWPQWITDLAQRVQSDAGRDPPDVLA